MSRGGNQEQPAVLLACSGRAHAPGAADQRQRQLSRRRGAAGLGQQPGHEHRTGRTVGVAQGEGAAVEVGSFRVDAELLEAGDRLGCERLVEFNQANVRCRQAVRREQPFAGRARTDPEQRGSTPAVSVPSTSKPSPAPSSRARRSDVITTAAAPSASKQEFPAVTLPPATKAGGNRASTAAFSPRRGPSWPSSDHRRATPDRPPAAGTILGVERSGGGGRQGAPVAAQRHGVLPVPADPEPGSHVFGRHSHVRIAVAAAAELCAARRTRARRHCSGGRAAVPC